MHVSVWVFLLFFYSIRINDASFILTLRVISRVLGKFKQMSKWRQRRADHQGACALPVNPAVLTSSSRSEVAKEDKNK